MAANGTKVPVTLKMSQREDAATGHATHVVHVTKASEEQRMDQQRLLLAVNHRGVIISCNASALRLCRPAPRLPPAPRRGLRASGPPSARRPRAAGAPKALVGFDASEVLVGKPLSSCIDVFGAWRERFGDEASLLGLLAAQAARGDGGDAKGAAGCAWRVGVRKPDAGGGSGGAAGVDGGAGSVLRTLQQRRVHAMCMTLELLHDAAAHADELLRDEAAADATPVLQVGARGRRAQPLACPPRTSPDGSHERACGPPRDARRSRCTARTR